MQDVGHVLFYQAARCILWIAWMDDDLMEMVHINMADTQPATCPGYQNCWEQERLCDT